jgi:hypothetical protein
MQNGIRMETHENDIRMLKILIHLFTEPKGGKVPGHKCSDNMPENLAFCLQYPMERDSHDERLVYFLSTM